MSTSPQFAINRVNGADAFHRYALDAAAAMTNRIHEALSIKAIEASVIFHIGPDISLSSNAERSIAGFVYGGVLSWRTERPVALPGIRPNGCGVLLCEIREDYNRDQFIEKALTARKHFASQWDYSSGNHFIAIYRDKNGVPYGLIHGGTKSIKDRKKPSESTYPEINPAIANKLTRVDTHSGSVSLLLDEDATEYYTLYKKSEKKIKALRQELSEMLWPNAHVLFHETHQGLPQQQIACLGAYLVEPGEKSLVAPIMIGPGKNLLLLKCSVALKHIPRISHPNNIPGATLNRLNQFVFLPHGAGDTNHEIEELTTLQASSPLIVTKMRCGGELIYYSPPPAPDHRSIKNTQNYFEQTGMTILDELTHILTLKI